MNNRSCLPGALPLMLFPAFLSFQTSNWALRFHASKRLTVFLSDSLTSLRCLARITWWSAISFHFLVLQSPNLAGFHYFSLLHSFHFLLPFRFISRTTTVLLSHFTVPSCRSEKREIRGEWKRQFILSVSPFNTLSRHSDLRETT